MYSRKKAYPESKVAATHQATEWYSRSAGVIFADYRGLTVKELQRLRRDVRAKGGELHVIKNTLFQRAIGEDANALPEDLKGGTTAYAFLFQNETEVTKLLFDFATSSKKLAVKGGLLAGKPYTAAQVEAFSKLPPRDILIAQVIGVVAAPLSNLVGVVEALYADPIRVIGAVADKVAEGSPLPAESAAPSSSASENEAPSADTAPAEEATAAAEAPAEDAANPEGESN